MSKEMSEETDMVNTQSLNSIYLTYGGVEPKRQKNSEPSSSHPGHFSQLSACEACQSDCRQE